MSRVRLRFAVACLLAAGLAAAQTAAALAQGGAPQATLSSLTATGDTTIAVQGFVVPGASVTSFTIDYGTSPSLGQSTPPVQIGSLPEQIPISQPLTGLTPGTTYYVQIVATSSTGNGDSAIMSQTTAGSAPAPPAPAPPRAQLTASALPHPGLGEAQLAGVSCLTGSFCEAVGLGGTGMLASGVAERFSAGSWRLQQTRMGGSESALNAVACASRSFCLAVGYSRNGTLGERFDGRSFAQVRAVNPPGPGSDLFNSVACPSRSDCWAVGATHGALNTPAGPLIEHWNGHAFTVAATPGANGYLTSVSCATAANCWAVGAGRAEHYNGRAWSAVRLPGSVGTYPGVSCSAVSGCWIVGARESRTAPPNPVALRLVGGRWRPVSMSAGPFPASNFIDSLACASADDCWAVGQSLSGGRGSTRSAPFAEQFNGSSWGVAKVTAPPGQQVALLAVSCARAGVCAAVGSVGGGSARTGFQGSPLAAVSEPG